MQSVTLSFETTYDREANAAYVYLADSIEPGGAVRQEVVDVEGVGTVVLDFDIDDRLLGVEVIGALGLLPVDLLRRLGQEAHPPR